MKTRVSGVPYEVVLEDKDMIATLEQENRFIRARMGRLEEELKASEGLLIKAMIDLENLRNASGKH